MYKHFDLWIFLCSGNCDSKHEAVPVRAMKVYGVSSGAASLIVNWWARCVSCQRHVLAALRLEENPGPYRIGG